MSNIASAKTASGLAGLRDLTSSDLPAIADYWLLSPDEYLTAMGVDRQRLGSAEDIHKRFFNAIRTGEAAQPSIALAITLDEDLVGYTLLNRYSDGSELFSLAHHRAELARKRPFHSAVSPPPESLFRLNTHFATNSSNANEQYRRKPHARQIHPRF